MLITDFHCISCLDLSLILLSIFSIISSKNSSSSFSRFLTKIMKLEIIPSKEMGLVNGNLDVNNSLKSFGTSSKIYII